MTTALTEVWETVNASSCPRQFNFHLHTLHSDGQLQASDLMQQAVDIGLQGLAITDHHSVEGYWLARKWLKHWQASAAIPGPALWSGVEITAQLDNTEVHLLGYDFEPTDQGLSPYLQGKRVTDERNQAKTVIAAIHAAGGLTVLAHPARYGRSPSELVAAAAEMGIDGIEAYYCYRNQEPWQPSPEQTHMMEQLGQQYQLQLTCGTDTHGLDIQRRL